jgi:hypothetical protein
MAREDPPGAFGMEVKADTSRDGFVDDGLIAFDERVVEARRQWIEADGEDFERVGRRRWRDRATGRLYRQADGCPLLAVGMPAVRDVVAFFIRDGKMVFLEPADRPEGTFVYHGPVVGRELDVQIAPRVIH